MLTFVKSLVILAILVGTYHGMAWAIDKKADEKALSMIMTEYQTSAREDARDQAMKAIVDSYVAKK